MKILQVLPALDSGGVERGVCDLSAYAAKEGYNIVVASAGGRLEEQLIKSGTQHIKLKLNSKNPLIIFINIFKLRKIISSNNIKIVHARSRAPAWSAYFACKLSKAKFITTFHGYYKITSPFKKFYNSIMAKGEKVIAVSEFIKKHITAKYSIKRDKITVIHRGVNLNEFKSENISDEERLKFLHNNGLSEKDFKILLPGRITRWKGHKTAIKALKKVNVENQKLVICGGWKGKEDYFEELNKLALDLQIESKIIFTNTVSNMPLAYEASDIVLNTSTEPETFGRVTAEAGAMCKPVIATNIGGSVEIVKNGETGYLVTPDNDEELAEKIEILFKDLSDATKKQKISKSARQHISNNFSLQLMCSETLKIYDEMLQNSL